MRPRTESVMTPVPVQRGARTQLAGLVLGDMQNFRVNGKHTGWVDHDALFITCVKHLTHKNVSGPKLPDITVYTREAVTCSESLRVALCSSGMASCG